jgi:hypothetical protein
LGQLLHLAHGAALDLYAANDEDGIVSV